MAFLFGGPAEGRRVPAVVTRMTVSEKAGSGEYHRDAYLLRQFEYRGCEEGVYVWEGMRPDDVSELQSDLSQLTTVAYAVYGFRPDKVKASIRTAIDILDARLAFERHIGLRHIQPMESCHV